MIRREKLEHDGASVVVTFRELDEAALCEVEAERRFRVSDPIVAVCCRAILDVEGLMAVDPKTGAVEPLRWSVDQLGKLPLWLVSRVAAEAVAPVVERVSVRAFKRSK